MVAEPHPNRPNPSPDPPPYEPQPDPLPEPPRDLPRRCLPRWWPERPGIAMGGGGAGFSSRVSPPEAPSARARATSTHSFPGSATPLPALVEAGVGRALDASSAIDDPPRSPSSAGAASSAESPPITNPPPPVARPQRNAPSRGAILILLLIFPLKIRKSVLCRATRKVRERKYLRIINGQPCADLCADQTFKVGTLPKPSHQLESSTENPSH